MSALEGIRQRAEAATEGPWKAERYWVHDSLDSRVRVTSPTDDDHCNTAELVLPEDAEFIAHARTDVPRMLDALDAVRALHMEDEQGKCAECTVAPFSVHSVKWPCPTVAAVNDSLEATS